MDKVRYDGDASSYAFGKDCCSFGYVFSRVVKDTYHELRVLNLEPGKQDFVVEVVEYLGQVGHMYLRETSKWSGGELGEVRSVIWSVMTKDRSVGTCMC